VAERLRGLWKGKVEVPEPCAAPIARVEGKFRFQLFLLVDKVPELMVDLKREVLAPKWPSGMRATVDVDAQDML
jgi:primosomal protein N'